MSSETHLSSGNSDQEITIGQRIKRLRLEHGWSQAQLGAMIKAHQKQISAYEREIHKPSAEVLLRLAELFDVSLDYLMAGVAARQQRAEIADRDLVRQMELVDRLPVDDKAAIKAVLESFIMRHRFQQLAGASSVD